jgi:nucleotide-binding universal stress UspA family protein
MTTTVLIALVIVLGIAVVALAAALFNYGVHHPARRNETRARRILFPFVANALSSRALDAALRLAHAEDATLVPIFLARVPLHLPLDAPLPRQAAIAIPLQEAIEHRAIEFGVPVDARIERGRDQRHALRQTIAHEQFDRLVIAAAARDTHGFDTDTVAWLLDHAPGEIVVLRPSPREQPLQPATGRADLLGPYQRKSAQPARRSYASPFAARN